VKPTIVKGFDYKAMAWADIRADIRVDIHADIPATDPDPIVSLVPADPAGIGEKTVAEAI
jgi:hypothetical protein